MNCPVGANANFRLLQLPLVYIINSLSKKLLINMKTELGMSKVTKSLIALACFVIIVAGMKTAASLVTPFMLSFFIAIICVPPLFWMQKKGVPKYIALLIILVVVIVTIIFIAAFVGKSINEFSHLLPTYQQQLSNKSTELVSWLTKYKIEVPQNFIKEKFNLGIIMKLVATSLTGLTSVLKNVFMILLTVAFILIEASDISNKLKCGLNNSKKSLKKLSEIALALNRYIALKSVFSLLTGILVAIWMAILGVDFALLWGFIAFLLNFIPTIGSIIAAVPAVLLALVQLGIGPAILVAIGFLAVNMLVGNILEPRIMGKGLGLSPLIVFLSMVFWGWVLGPVGMFLSAPLTMIVKIIFEANQETKNFALLLGNGSKNKK